MCDSDEESYDSLADFLGGRGGGAASFFGGRGGKKCVICGRLGFPSDFREHPEYHMEMCMRCLDRLEQENDEWVEENWEDDPPEQPKPENKSGSTKMVSQSSHMDKSRKQITPATSQQRIPNNTARFPPTTQPQQTMKKKKIIVNPYAKKLQQPAAGIKSYSKQKQGNKYSKNTKHWGGKKKKTVNIKQGPTQNNGKRSYILYG